MTPSVRIMFIDMNSFYASVEMQDNVGFRGKPTIVVPVMSDNSPPLTKQNNWEI